MSDAEHVLEAGGCWTNDNTSLASVRCTHPHCWTNWSGYWWDDDKPLTEIVAESHAAHDAWLADRETT